MRGVSSTLYSNCILPLLGPCLDTNLVVELLTGTRDIRKTNTREQAHTATAQRCQLYCHGTYLSSLGKSITEQFSQTSIHQSSSAQRKVNEVTCIAVTINTQPSRAGTSHVQKKTRTAAGCRRENAVISAKFVHNNDAFFTSLGFFISPPGSCT